MDSLKGDQRIKSLSGREFAAALQYNATLRIARLGIELLTRTAEDRQEGLSFGLTKRPMFEAYTRGIWLEKVATEDRARGLLWRHKEDAKTQPKRLRSKANSPSLTGMWDALENKKVLDEFDAETVRLMRDMESWWNDATHINARSVWLGWSDATANAVQDEGELRRDAIAAVEFGAQSARHIHRIIEGIDGSPKVQRIFKEKDYLRTLLELDEGWTACVV